ncbi:hypothetical protein [Hydrogenivirga sp.]
MKRTLLVLFVLFLIFSCAKKVERECVYDPKAIDRYEHRRVPENFRIYGLIKYGPLKFPMMLAKFDGLYTVKVARARALSLKGRKLCLEKKCYILPAPPENLVFGKLLTGKEYSFCRNGLLYFRQRGELYERLVVFEGNRPKELSIINRRKNRSVKVLLGEEDERGFFRELRFLLDGREVKLLIEEVES